jgi:hypothetical protein
MNRRSTRRFTTFLLLALAGLLSVPLPPAAVEAQSNQISAQAVILYRFRVSNNNLGYMLHPFVTAGQNLGYTNEGQLWPPFGPDSGGLVLPQGPGVTPAAGNPLIPIYQWRVVQGSRTYYYYSGPSHTGGSGYYFEGQLGWVLPPSFQSGTLVNGRSVFAAPVHYYYSQRYGYWYAALPEGSNPLAVCYPDGGCGGPTSFAYHGVGFKIPIWSTAPSCQFGGDICGPPTFIFNQPAAPECNPTQEQSCYDNGGSWNPSTCRCTFMIDPDPCGGQRICMEQQQQQTAPPQSVGPQDEAAPPAPEPPPDPTN